MNFIYFIKNVIMNNKKNFPHLSDQNLEDFKKDNTIPFLNKNSTISLSEQKETLKIDIGIKPHTKKTEEASVSVDYKINNKTPLMHILFFMMK